MDSLHSLKYEKHTIMFFYISAFLAFIGVSAASERFDRVSVDAADFSAAPDAAAAAARGVVAACAAAAAGLDPPPAPDRSRAFRLLPRSCSVGTVTQAALEEGAAGGIVVYVQSSECT